MNFEQALTAMKEGKCVKRPSHREAGSLYRGSHFTDTALQFWHRGSETWVLRTSYVSRDILADDWEIVPDPSKPEEPQLRCRDCDAPIPLPAVWVNGLCGKCEGERYEQLYGGPDRSKPAEPEPYHDANLPNAFFPLSTLSATACNEISRAVYIRRLTAEILNECRKMIRAELERKE